MTVVVVFFLPLLRKCCVVIEKNVDKKACKYKGCLKGKFGGGSKSAKGGPYPLADLDHGVPRFSMQIFTMGNL